MAAVKEELCALLTLPPCHLATLHEAWARGLTRSRQTRQAPLSGADKDPSSPPEGAIVHVQSLLLVPCEEGGTVFVFLTFLFARRAQASAGWCIFHDTILHRSQLSLIPKKQKQKKKPKP